MSQAGSNLAGGGGGGGTGNTNSFLAYLSAPVTDVTGNGTIYQVVFNDTLANYGSNYSTSTGLYTAPSTGLYQFSTTITFIGTQSATEAAVVFTVSNGDSYNEFLNPANIQIGGELVMNFSTAIYMTATNTVAVDITVAGIGLTAGVGGAGPATLLTFFSGYLIQT